MERRAPLNALLPAVTLAATAIGAVFQSASVRADPPYAIVSSGVTDFSLAEPKLFWHTASGCVETPDHGPPINADRPEVISRRASTGGNIREIFNHNPSRPPRTCNPYEFRSRVLADRDHAYWVEASGLVRLSTDANPGDAPELVANEVWGSTGGMLVDLAQDSDHVYAITRGRGTSTIWRVSKAG